MKLNIFKINSEQYEDLKAILLTKGYVIECEKTANDIVYELYLLKKEAKRESWIDIYSELLTAEKLSKYQKQLQEENLAGVLLIKTALSIFAISHGQVHFLLRLYCEKDFGLDLAERIAQQDGLSIKHSQTFTSLGQKDITSYNKKRSLEEVIDYGEAFNYLKCKTIDPTKWGEVIDFGESARFTSTKNFLLNFIDIGELIKNIDNELKKHARVTIPRYQQVRDPELINDLNSRLTEHFINYIDNIVTDEYWLTGVTFNFMSEQRCSVKYLKEEILPITNGLDPKILKDAIDHKKDQISDYNKIRVIFFDESDNKLYYKYLKELMLVTIEIGDKYYVSYDGRWYRFSESYLNYIKQRVDEVGFEIKESYGLGENELIDKLVKDNKYTQLHKRNIYIGKYCIEQADLMDDENVIMIKDQNETSDLVYLIAQAKTSIRLTKSGEISENIFKGRNVCLWMLLKRKSLDKLSDLKSFHLLDAINEFRKEVQSKGFEPRIWISLKTN